MCTIYVPTYLSVRWIGRSELALGYIYIYIYIYSHKLMYHYVDCCNGPMLILASNLDDEGVWLLLNTTFRAIIFQLVGGELWDSVSNKEVQICFYSSQHQKMSHIWSNFIITRFISLLFSPVRSGFGWLLQYKETQGHSHNIQYAIHLRLKSKDDWIPEMEFGLWGGQGNVDCT